VTAVDAVFELRARAAELRAGALALIDRSGLDDLLVDRFGGRLVAGSVDFDLMVWPDVDLYVRAEADAGAAFLALPPAIHHGCRAAGLDLVKASFNDEYRRPGNPYGEGLYLGLRIADGDRLWKVDLWGWSEATFARKTADHARLAADLARADRDLVLAIKDAVHRRPEYRGALTSLDVYAFALAGAGRSVADFDAWVAGKAPR
jgi:hypothetical protein